MKKTLILACLLIALSLRGQQAPPPIYVAPDAPLWMHLLQDENPEAQAVQRAYEAWRDTALFEKNAYTQYYKRWMHWARSRKGAGGETPRERDAGEWAKEQEARQRLRRSVPAEKEFAPVWSFSGPVQTFHTDGVTPVSWQTNIYCIAIAPSNPAILYAGGETGGIWRTDDKGLNWRLLSAEVLHAEIGAIAIHPSNPDMVYFGTNGRLMKSDDGGLSWSQVYAETNLSAHRIACHPSNPDVVLAATSRGLLRTANAGQTWQKLWTQETWDLRFKPGDPDAVFAVRKNGAGSNLMRSLDGGLNFSVANQGWPQLGAAESVTGALLAVCPSKPDKLYAYLCGAGANLKGYVGVFVSHDSGLSWANTQQQNAIGNSPVPYSIPNHVNLMTNNGLFSGFEQGFYDMAIIVNPLDDNELIAGGTSWFRSADGGKTWQGMGGYVGNLAWSHPDTQDLAAVGTDLWIASDGGLDYSDNFGATIQSRVKGISGADMWGFDAGWNEVVLVGGRYHNGNMAWHESFPEGKYYRMGGAEAPTGYVNPGINRMLYFSDIGGQRLIGGFGAGVKAVPIGLFPNESYAYYANSEMAWDPRCWNVVYIGYENKIWKSTDGGRSYDLLYAFPGPASHHVYEIEVSRKNPDIIYCSQWDGTDDAMWRSANGGLTWSALAPLPLPNNNDRVKMALSAEDPNTLWVAVSYGSNGRKVYKTADGGVSWQNLTTPILNGVTVSNIMAQYGTDGGVYLGTNRGVFYRNNTHGDWQPYSDGLPISAETNRLKPHYRDGRLFNGCWGFGVWEAPLFEPSATQPKAMCSALYTACARDTIYFEDHSVVRHDGASWHWEFPCAWYVDDLNIRNPRVVYNLSDQFMVVMHLTTPEGVFSDTLYIEVGNACEPDPTPGQALQIGGNNSPGYATIPALDTMTNTLSFTAWIKPTGIQPEYSGIVIHEGETAGFNFRPGSNDIGYHWPNGAWWWNSGLSAPTDRWSHVAMTVAPDGITIYVNGVGAKHTFNVPPVSFDSEFRIGSYKGWGDRYVAAQIDEVCVFNRTLTQAEIREQMHLCRNPEEDAGLIAYYQFNEASGPALDRAGTRHVSLAGSAARVGSDAPVGPGQSARLTLTQTGEHVFGQTGLSLLWTSNQTPPSGEWCATRIEHRPDRTPPLGDDTLSVAYWALHHFGPTFSPPAEARLAGLGPILPDWPETAVRLWRRNPTAHGPVWTLVGPAQSVDAGPDGSARFGTSPLPVPAQWIVTAPADSLPVIINTDEIPLPAPTPEYRLSPNPLAPDGAISVWTNDSDTPYTLRLFNAAGMPMRRYALRGPARVPVEGLAPGVYWYRIETPRHLSGGSLLVR